MSNYQATGLPGSSETASLPPMGKTSGSDMRTYVIAGITCFVLACLVFIIAKPVEKTGPPQPEQGMAGGPEGAAMPQGHPDTSAAGAIAQLTAYVESLHQAVDATPKDPALQLELANALYDLGQASNSRKHFQEALGHYQTYLAVSPQDPDARTDMAYALFRTGKLDEAIRELNKVRAANPKHQQSAFNLAILYKEKDMPDSVLAYLRVTAEIDSTTNAGQAAVQALGAYRQAH